MINKTAQFYSEDQLSKDLQKALSLNDPDQLQSYLLTLASKVTHPDYSQKILMLCKSTQIANPGELSGGMSVKDPISGKKYENTKDKIEQFLNELKGINSLRRKSNMENNNYNLSKYSQNQSDDRKKKSRGNPFRVLMGKVGKLLDHGLSKKDIVRYIKKENIWDENTIEKSIDIVKEYNKKKTRKRHKEAQTLIANAEEWPSIEIDYTKRSNAELITSLCWLHSLNTFDSKKYSFDHKQVEDKSRVKTKIRNIKAELLRRGMSEDALNLILK